MIFAVKTEVLKKAFEDPETSRKLDKAVTFEEVAVILAEFCRRKGFRVKIIEVEQK